MRVRTTALTVLLIAAVVASLVLLARSGSVPGVPGPRPAETCSVPDPTTARGCLTPTGRRLYDRTVARFGAPGPAAPIRSVTCWGTRETNADSDHPAGRACDFFPGRAGAFASGAELDAGWAMANWLRDNAADLDVSYVIWQGRIWVAGDPDLDGWGKPYDGGGAYDPNDATGGHFDHVHVSVSP